MAVGANVTAAAAAVVVVVVVVVVHAAVVVIVTSSRQLATLQCLALSNAIVYVAVARSRFYAQCRFLLHLQPHRVPRIEVESKSNRCRIDVELMSYVRDKTTATTTTGSSAALNYIPRHA